MGPFAPRAKRTLRLPLRPSGLRGAAGSDTILPMSEAAAASFRSRLSPARRLPVVVSVFALLAAVLLVASACRRGPAYALPFGPSPFAPAEPRLEGVEALAPDALAGSAACGRCHDQIYRQWQASLHRAAAVDPFTRFAIEHNAEDYGVPAVRLCVACHEPGLLLALGVDRSARPDPASRIEGVSCLSCHLVTDTRPSAQTGVVANGSFTVTPLDPALVLPDSSADVEATRRHALALRRPFLSENRFCDSCHRFFIPTELGGSPPGRLRLQSAEADGTRYGDPAAPGYRSCVDCHMPRMPGSDPAAKDGMIHDHRALGANLLVPALEGDDAQFQATLAFRQAGAVAIDVGSFERDAATGLTLPVVLRNQRNGHDFPTGATDVSEAWLELTLRDAAGNVVFQSPGLGPDRYLSPDAPSLNSILTLPGGDMDFLHDLMAQVGLREHPRIRPEGSRTLRFAVRLPDGAGTPLRAHVVLRARHGNERWNRWVFNFTDVVVPVADLAWADRDLGAPPPAVASPAAPSPPPALPAPDGMVFVPGGTYVLGVDPQADPDAEPEESPAHPVELRPFFLDRVPVTNAAWAEAVKRGVVRAPPPMAEPPLDVHSWRDARPPSGMDDHPVVLVRQSEAADYCRAVGKRLPTESEWEAAARGQDGRRFAWGNRFDGARCNTAGAARGRTVPVGSMPANASPFGALDLGCNVAEWVSSVFEAYPRKRQLENRDDWVDHFGAGMTVTRGATYDNSWLRARTTARGFDGGQVRKLIGFRCAKDVEGGAR